MNEQDHALVVGIRRYRPPAEGQSPWVADLRGPDNDALAISDWLKSAEGGALPESNVRLVRSADFPDPFAEGGAAPQQHAIEAALTDLAFLPRDAYKEDGQNYAGRRLYIYVSGHGFAKDVDEAALITAEAVKDRPMNVLITSWLDWYYRAAHFREYVLWVDTCLSNAPTPYLKACDLNVSNGRNIKNGRRFFAFSAGFNEKAVESEIGGEWHGVFTHALLQGLTGAAGGNLTSAGLRDYLLNNMKTFMSEDQIASGFAQEPFIPFYDTVEFAPERAAQSFPVTLRFPDGLEGKQVNISVGPGKPVKEETLEGNELALDLEPGVYAAYLPESDQVGAFAVTGADTGVIEPLS